MKSEEATHLITDLERRKSDLKEFKMAFWEFIERNIVTVLHK
ncbi:hypothetical protein AAHB49_22360 [Bacillus cereus]